MLKVYKLSVPGSQATAADLKPESLVLQQSEIIEPAEQGAAAQSFSLEGAKYSYSASYMPQTDYESSSVRLVVDSGRAPHPDAYDVTLQSGQTKIVVVGGYAIAVSMQPAVDDSSGT